MATEEKVTTTEEKETAVEEKETVTKRVWDNYKMVAEVQKNERNKFIIALACRDGYRYMIVREFYLRKRDGAWMPGRDGIQIPLKAPLNKGEAFIEPLADLIDAMVAHVGALKELELVDEANTITMEVPKRDYSKKRK